MDGRFLIFRGHGRLLGYCPKLDQAPVAVADRTRVRHLNERKIFHVAQAQTQHAQDYTGERRTQNFRLAVARPPGEILLAV